MSLDINKISTKNSLTSCFGGNFDSMNGGEEFLKLMSDHADEVTISQDEYLLNEGELATYVFIPISGSVMLERTASNGNRQVYAFLFTGNILGLSTATMKTYNFSAKALSDLTAIRIERQVLEHFFKQYQEYAEKYHNRTEIVLSSFLDHVFVMGQITAHQRLGHFLMDMEKRLFCHNGRFNLPMSRQDIADYLGMTVSTACRGFSALKRRGLIQITSNSFITILDRDALEEYVNK